MRTNAGAKEVVTKLVPGGDAGLAHLSDRELLASTRALVGSSNRIFAALLAHLAEVDARGLHRTRACASLYTYCIYELRFSEDAAARRAGAAKLVKRFPLLLPAIANGELHLTGLLMLGPHFTPENIVEVLGRAKFRTKRELAKLVRELHPLPLVPDLVEPSARSPARCVGQQAKSTRRPSRPRSASYRSVNGQKTGRTTPMTTTLTRFLLCWGDVGIAPNWKVSRTAVLRTLQRLRRSAESHRPPRQRVWNRCG